MIYVTGDIHGQPHRLNSQFFPESKDMTKDDYVIILGDFGIIWDKEENKTEKYWLDWLENKPFTTLFVDGNHENHERLTAFPVEKWHGGQVHKIRPSVMHLMRGEVFDIEGLKFLAMGGAESHDIQHGIIDPADYETRDELRQACRDLENKHGGWQFTMYRIKGESWWEQEVPSEIERAICMINLVSHNNKVDFILTHEAPSSNVALLSGGFYHATEYSEWLEKNIRQHIDYNMWLFGHYHIDKRINEKEACLFEQVTRIH